MVTVNLNGVRNGLKIENTPNEFCVVFLICEDGYIRLGTDLFVLVISALKKGINIGEKKRLFSYGGKENLYTIITLMDPYMVIAGIETDSGIEINFIDKEGRFLPTVILGDSDICYWQRILTNYESILARNKA